jgi:hypothetical protein
MDDCLIRRQFSADEEGVLFSAVLLNGCRRWCRVLGAWTPEDVARVSAAAPPAPTWWGKSFAESAVEMSALCRWFGGDADPPVGIAHLCAVLDIDIAELRGALYLPVLRLIALGRTPPICSGCPYAGGPNPSCPLTLIQRLSRQRRNAA